MALHTLGQQAIALYSGKSTHSSDLSSGVSKGSTAIHSAPAASPSPSAQLLDRSVSTKHPGPPLRQSMRSPLSSSDSVKTDTLPQQEQEPSDRSLTSQAASTNTASGVDSPAPSVSEPVFPQVNRPQVNRPIPHTQTIRAILDKAIPRNRSIKTL